MVDKNYKTVIGLFKEITKKNNGYIYSAIHYKNKFSYVTDGRIAIKTGYLYIDELEGKALSMSTHTLVQGQIPDYDRVFNKDGFQTIEKDFEVPEWVYELKDGANIAIYFDSELKPSLTKVDGSIFCLNARILRHLKHLRYKYPIVYFHSENERIILEYTDFADVVIMPIKF